jgi:hypothetical protein
MSVSLVAGACLGALRGWWDEKRDAKRTDWGGGTGTRFRWWAATQVDRLPGQCWADLTDYGLGRDLVPWAPDQRQCIESARDCGTCYCGKVVREDVAAMPGAPRFRKVVSGVSPEATP